MTQYLRFVIVAAALCAVSLTTGCGPAYLKQGFDVGTMDKVVVLPVMDGRSDPNPKHDFEQMKLAVQAGVGRAIRYIAGHRAHLSSDIGQVGSYTVDRLPRFEKEAGKLIPQGVNRDWVRNLGPESCRWTAVPVIEGVSEYYAVLVAGGSATLSLYIFDRQDGDLVWFDRMVTRAHGTGLIEAATVALAMDEVNYVEGAATMLIKKHLQKKKAPFLLPD